VADEVVISFAALLRRLRANSGLTQDELAVAAGIHPRTVSDLERGISTRAQKATIRLLADALKLDPPVRAQFEAAARGRPISDRDASQAGGLSDTGDPHEWLKKTVAALDELGAGAAHAAIGQWREKAHCDTAWLLWAEQLVTLTAVGRLTPSGQRPLPVAPEEPFLGRDSQTAVLGGFLERMQRGRGGLALVLGPEGIGKSRLIIETLASRTTTMQAEWVTLDRGEAGYRAWRRLLAPIWISCRRSELAPVSLLPHTPVLDDILLPAAGADEPGAALPGEVAAAFAALLQHAARRCPIVIVLDDAHRGGASSDHLLIEVSRRVSARAVGIIAGVRPDELEDRSPLRDYVRQADGRTALDLVMPVHVPALDFDAVAGMLRERIGTLPPADVVEQVLTQTGGHPQLVKFSRLEHDTHGSGTSQWQVRELDAEGSRGLEYAVLERSPETRHVLYAAAVCAAGHRIDAPLVAHVAGLPLAAVEQILDAERRRESILMPRVSGYWFQHGSWVDTLMRCCPLGQLRSFHARCLASLQTDADADALSLARHAIAAGPPLVEAATLVMLAADAAEAALADHAFGTAARLYAAAAQHSTGAERVRLLISQADALRFGGGWEQAQTVLRRAASLARTLDSAGYEALALVHLERLTWSYGLEEKELTEQLRDLLRRLPDGEGTLRAQAQAGLALRLTISPRRHENEHLELAEAARRHLPAVPPSPARADILIGVRGGMQDSAPPEELLDYDQQMIELGLRFHSAYHLEEALVCRVIDLIRAGRLHEIPPAVRAHREFSERSTAQLVLYSQALLDAMLALAHGDFPSAGACNAEAARLSAGWGKSMAHEALMAQSGWLLYETGQLDGLGEVLAALPEEDVSGLNEQVWRLGAALIHAEQGDTAAASAILRQVAARTADFVCLARGPSRIGILATAATVLAHPNLAGVLATAETSRWGTSLARLLESHPDDTVLAGWPAVILGSKYRFIGLAQLASGDLSAAVTNLTKAADRNAYFAVLSARTQFDLARALMRQPSTRSNGTIQMQQVEQQAVDLGMAGLAAQAHAQTIDQA